MAFHKRRSTKVEAVRRLAPSGALTKTDEQDTAATCLDEACLKVMLSLTSGEVGSCDLS
jgi:hypothetical protein